MCCKYRQTHRIFVLAVALALLSCGSELTDPIGPNGVACPRGNRSPHIDPIPAVSVDEGELLQVSFFISDPDGDLVFLEAEPVPEGATFNPIQGTLTWHPGFELVSADEETLAVPDVVVTVDDECLSDAERLYITVVHVNQKPFFLSTDSSPLAAFEAMVEPGDEARLQFQVVDPDEDELVITLDGSPAYARLEDDDRTLVLSPTEGDSGEIDDFNIQAGDGTDTSVLSVQVIVGEIEVELPVVTGLTQEDIEGVVEVGGAGFEGRFSFSAEPHSFEHDDLRLQVNVALVDEAYEDGETGIGDPESAGVRPYVDIVLEGGYSYRWRARYLSDLFGASAFASFGGNSDTDPDLFVDIVPETVLDVMPNDPSPIDVTFEFYSTNVTDFECQLDDSGFSECNTGRTNDCSEGRVACRDLEDCTCARRDLRNVSEDRHTFTVRAITRDGAPDPTPEVFAWDVLAVDPPDTSFSSAPLSNYGCEAIFRFTGEPSPVTFECRLEKTGSGGFAGDWLPCTSPKEYTGFTSGNYRFYVRATNLVGVVDSSPVSAAFVVTCD